MTLAILAVLLFLASTALSLAGRRTADPRRAQLLNAGGGLLLIGALLALGLSLV
ncbi:MULTISPECIES: hypothetical protein [Pacificimonas]|uniref:Uncharacterized protein n=1 Tax=Pacificimonas aurantium TaxID=1250540 RepID=A0ABS7WJ40_9SPHN|nr:MULTISPECIES: hypothetical protein [Pacificimonas]MBZ6378414.1 hypothetical protein [Pacificimonas aurantium]